MVSAAAPGSAAAEAFPGRLRDGAAARAPGGFGGTRRRNATVSSAFAKLLETGASHYEWTAATEGSDSAASMELATGGTPVMAIGGFRGTDPAPSLAEFEKLVAERKIHYYVAGDGGGFGGRGGGGGFRRGRRFRRPGPARAETSVTSAIVAPAISAVVATAAAAPAASAAARRRFRRRRRVHRRGADQRVGRGPLHRDHGGRHDRLQPHRLTQVSAVTCNLTASPRPDPVATNSTSNTDPTSNGVRRGQRQRFAFVRKSPDESEPLFRRRSPACGQARFAC